MLLSKNEREIIKTSHLMDTKGEVAIKFHNVRFPMTILKFTTQLSLKYTHKSQKNIILNLFRLLPSNFINFGVSLNMTH